MPLDVPTVSYTLPDGVDPPSLLAYLDKRFPVIAEPGASRSYTVLDSADRRLRAAGVDLDLETGRSGPRLVLREPGGRAPLVADVRRPRRSRYLLRDLPAGPLRERLAPIVEMRALLPLASVQVGAQLVRVLDAEDKTVARVSLASPMALVGSGEAGAVPLTPRVDVSGVLGYPKPLGRVTAAVRRGPKGGLIDARISLADEAIAAMGGDPEGIRTKVRVDLRLDQRTDRAAVAVLCDLAGMVEANLPGTLADLDTEFLHDLRVAVRRSRSVLRELKGAFPPEPLAAQRDALRWIQAVTGPTRDLDVQLLDWDHLVSGIPSEGHAALAPVRALLARH
ncbi:MAG: CHAD domain-containing protein, partial [Acidimicrobiales bacterium]